MPIKEHLYGIHYCLKRLKKSLVGKNCGVRIEGLLKSVIITGYSKRGSIGLSL